MRTIGGKAPLFTQHTKVTMFQIGWVYAPRRSVALRCPVPRAPAPFPKGAALARFKPFPPKTTVFLAPGRAQKMRFGSPRRGFPFATPRSPRGKGAAAAAPEN